MSPRPPGRRSDTTPETGSRTDRVSFFNFLVGIEEVSQSGLIVLLNEGRQEALSWDFREGWLDRWEGSST